MDTKPPTIGLLAWIARHQGSSPAKNRVIAKRLSKREARTKLKAGKV